MFNLRLVNSELLALVGYAENSQQPQSGSSSTSSLSALLWSSMTYRISFHFDPHPQQDVPDY
jgi:hypothetical protein